MNRQPSHEHRTAIVALLSLLIIYSHQSFAKTQDNTCSTITTIVVEGNKKLSDAKIKQSLTFTEGNFVCDNDLNSSKKRLTDTGLFSQVVIKKIEKQTISVVIQEVWTTIPILKLNRGGGVNQITVGLYDPNLFNQYLESGFQYERLGDTNSGALWFKKPTQPQSPFGFEAQAWSTQRIRTKFDQSKDSPTPTTGFLQKRNKALLRLSYEYDPTHFLSMKYEYNQDKFSTELIDDEILPLVNLKGLPPKTHFHFIGAEYTWDKFDNQIFFSSGEKLIISADYAFSEDSTDSFFQASGSYKNAQRLTANLGWVNKFEIGFSSTSVLQYWFYFGGLNSIRGFTDNRFAGKYYWLLNSELRYNFLQRKNFQLQAVSFIDGVSTADKFSNYGRLSGAAVGAGLRLNLPKFYRLVIRADVAKPIYKSDENFINFGFQQFF